MPPTRSFSLLLVWSFLGAMLSASFVVSVIRGQADFLIWDHFEKTGWQGWASVPEIFAYAVFYSSLFVIPYTVLRVLIFEKVAGIEIDASVVSLWIGATAILFHQPILAFLETLSVFRSNFGFLLIVGWFLLTVGAVPAWREMFKAKAEQQERNMGQRLALFRDGDQANDAKESGS